MSDLPHVLNLVADVLGEAAALRLAAAVGGQRRYVPADPAGARLAGEVGALGPVGEDVVAVLAAHYPGESVYIPRGPADRSTAAEEVRRSNLSANQLAARLRVSVRTVHRLRSGVRGVRDPRQGELL